MATTTARSSARRASAMSAFDYAALDERGQIRHGRIDAADLGTGRSQLERQRLVPVRVEPASARTAPPARKDIGSAFDRFTAKDVALVTRQLATMVTAAPLEEALRTIAARSEEPTSE